VPQLEILVQMRSFQTWITDREEEGFTLNFYETIVKNKFITVSVCMHY
jgi:hypothetical protein